MHDLRYENQKRLDDQDLVGYARQLGLDDGRFEQDLVAHTYGDRVHEDFMSGVRSGVNGTPSFYINGHRYDDSYDAEALISALEHAAA
jgi:protein-disulfide isomerase